VEPTGNIKPVVVTQEMWQQADKVNSNPLWTSSKLLRWSGLWFAYKNLFNSYEHQIYSYRTL
jgi:hypothetical protein